MKQPDLEAPQETLFVMEERMMSELQRGEKKCCICREELNYFCPFSISVMIGRLQRQLCRILSGDLIINENTHTKKFFDS